MPKFPQEFTQKDAAHLSDLIMVADSQDSDNTKSASLQDIKSLILADERAEVLTYETRDDFPEQGELDCIYIAADTNICYRFDDIEGDYIQVGGVNTMNGQKVVHATAVNADHIVSTLPAAKTSIGTGVYICNGIAYRPYCKSRRYYLWRKYTNPVLIIDENLYYENDGAGNVQTATPDENVWYADDLNGNAYLWLKSSAMWVRIDNADIDAAATADDTIYVSLGSFTEGNGYDLTDTESILDEVGSAISLYQATGGWRVVISQNLTDETGAITSTDTRVMILSTTTNGGTITQTLTDGRAVAERSKTTEGNWGEWSLLQYAFGGCVSYTESQNLTEAEKNTALTNLGLQLDQELDKPVVAVDNYDALAELTDPSEDFLYLTKDTQKVYTFDGVDFVEVAGSNILYTYDLTNLPAGVESSDYGTWTACLLTENGIPGEESSLTLTGYTTSRGQTKIQAIKAVRDVLGVGLKEAKTLVESIPCVAKTGIEDAEGVQYVEQLAARGVQATYTPWKDAQSTVTTPTNYYTLKKGADGALTLSNEYGFATWNATNSAWEWNYYSFGDFDTTELEEKIATNTTNIAANTAAIAENVTAIAALDDKTLDKVIPTTYAELLAMVDGGTLVAGQQYRITDFVTTVANDAEARSAGHTFDLIVVADDEKTLNAAARAIAHDGDTYFANADLSKWQVWYDIHNDTTRYQWADATSGKGVIYRLIDEWQNDCPYDFKNVQFKRYKVTHDDDHDNLSSLDGYYLGTGGENYGLTTDTSDYVWCYTFDSIDGDVSVIAAGSDALSYAYKRRMFNNVIAPYASIMTIDGDTYVVRCLNNITLCTQLNSEQSQYSLPNTCSIGGQVFNIGIVDAIAITIGYDTQNIIAGQCFEMNDLGAGGAVMTFGDYCYSNTFGNGCYSNTFGDSCRYNTFGNSCYSNTFGNGCDSNTFGNSCYYNTFGNSCYSNTFGNECYSNTLGNNCRYNTFGTRTASVKTTKDYMRYISVESGVQYVNITCSATTSDSAYAQNAVVHSGVAGTSSAYKTCTISATNTAYLTEFGEKVQGTIS